MQKNTDIVSKTIKILGNCIFFPFIFIILLCSIMMYISKTNRQVPSLFGYSVVTVLTGSMEPDFSPGDTVIVKATRVGDLKVGDVIFINGLKIIWMKSFMKINNPKQSVAVTGFESYEDLNVIDNDKYTPVSDEEANADLYSEDDYFYHNQRHPVYINPRFQYPY